MNIEITTDYLLERNHLIEMVEFFLAQNEKANITTFAHKEKAILGPIELRYIRSSQLSNKINSVSEFKNSLKYIPSISKNLFIPCSTDWVINISGGLSHGITKCKDTKQFTYLYDLPNEKRTGFKNKIVGSFIDGWAMRQLAQVDVLWVSNQILKEKINKIYPAMEIQVVPPFFNVQDFPIIPSSIFEYNYYVINADGLELKTAKSIINILEDLKIKYYFVGQDQHLNSLKNDENRHLFFGEKCSGELAPLLAGSKALIDLSKKPFPKLALCSLSTGRPVIVTENISNKSFLNGPGVYYLKDNDLVELNNMINEFELDSEDWDSKKISAYSKNYHPSKFKGEVERSLSLEL
jgi:hypothetical protein